MKNWRFNRDDRGSITTGRRRTLADHHRADIAARVKMLLETSRRAWPRVDGWNIYDSSYAEAFGCMQALQAMGYGYFGSSVENADDPRNLSAWFERLKAQVHP